MVTPLEPGDPRRLGRWRLVGRLGAGGMGVVYLGRRRGRRHRRVAIKVPRAEFARDAHFRDRFRREAEAASAITARGVARVLEVRADGERPYLVTEYVEGPTLHAAVTTDGPLAGPHLVSFAVGVAEAVAAMHAARVTHRDLTPGNVILGRFGPKVIDFGIARAADDLTLTQTGARIGTPAWMAPEQARGDRVGPAADTFAWGSLVAFAGTGRHPFGNGRVDAVLYRVVHEPADLAGLDPAVAPLVARALDKDAAARPGPRELLDALTPLESPPATPVTRVLPVPVTTPVRPPRPSGPPRRWLRVAMLSVLIAAAGVGLGLGAAFWIDRDDDREAALGPSEPEPAATSTTAAPTTTTSPRSTVAYCGLARELDTRLGELDGGSDIFDIFEIFTPDNEADAAFIEFAAANRTLFSQMRDTAPEEMAADVDIVMSAYERAADGDLSGFETLDYLDAETRTMQFEEEQCGIAHGQF
jgi:serine/threonine protein kinase